MRNTTNPTRINPLKEMKSYLFQLLKDVIKPPKTESCSQLRDRGQSIEELLGRTKGDVWLGSLGLCQHGTLIISGHQVGQQFLFKMVGRREGGQN